MGADAHLLHPLCADTRLVSVCNEIDLTLPGHSLNFPMTFELFPLYLLRQAEGPFIAYLMVHLTHL